MVKRFMVASAMVIGCAIVLPDYPDFRVKAADLPCELKLGEPPPAPPPAEPVPPKAPTGVRIITSLLEPLFRGVPAFAAIIPHTYYQSLASRTDCLGAYHLRTQAMLDAIPTAAESSDKRLPIVYDPVQDAAMATINAPITTDVKGKMLPMRISSGSLLLTWDFRFDPNFRWMGDGYVRRHKTWRINPGPWLAIRTDYQHAANQGQFAEVYLTMPGARFLAPGTWRGAPGWYGEMLQPQVGTFYFDPDTWVRVWIFVEGLDKEICYLSAWAADERRDPVQLYNNIALYPNVDGGGFGNFQIEFDTSGETGINPKEMHAWNRNAVMLQNVSRSTVLGMLKRPGA
jgi:hypothetical protein